VVLSFRCVPFDSNQLPVTCKGYYDTNGGYFDGSTIDGLQMILDEEIANSIPDDAETCVDFVQRYLCYYYFPVCNLTTGVILPSCSASCNLLTNNQDCKVLIQTATRAIEQRINNIAIGGHSNNSPDGTCLITVNTSYIANTTLSTDCIPIEGMYLCMCVLYSGVQVDVRRCYIILY